MLEVVVMTRSGHHASRTLRTGLCLWLTLQMSACGGGGVATPAEVTTPPPSTPSPATPPPAPAPSPAPSPPPTAPPATPPATPTGKALSAYLRNLSPRLEGVTVDNARVEQYRILTRDGTVLDSWVRRPPGEFGQPLVLVFTPYYEGGNLALAASDPSRETAEHLLPYGYAVGLVSIGGTGNSGGCYRNGGSIERQQIYDAAEHLATQSWSNGAIAAIGLSYEGGTAIDQFVTAPPSIKAVVPMQGVSDEYRTRFGTGAIGRRYNPFYNTLIYPQVMGGTGITDPEGVVTGVRGEPCPEQLDIQSQSASNQLAANKTAYMKDRDAITAVAATPERPRPAMFYIQSYQDPVVEPNMADGFLEAVRATGTPLHIWFGQWTHTPPQDADCARGAPCRGDFWEIALLAWFDQFLKGRDTGILEAPLFQTQADDGVWRHEGTWPPPADTVLLHPQTNGDLAESVGSGTASYRDDGTRHLSEINAGRLAALPTAPGSTIEFVGAPLAAPLRLMGVPLLHTHVTADGRQANVVATLLERKDDGTQRYLNFAALNLNHAQSLEQRADDITDQPLDVTLRFYPQDNMVAAGSRLVLHIAGDIETTRSTAGDPQNLLNFGMHLLLTTVGANVTLDLAETALQLPISRSDHIEDLPWATAR